MASGGEADASFQTAGRRESIKKGGARQTRVLLSLESVLVHQPELGPTVCSLSESVTIHHQPGSSITELIKTSVVQVTIENYR